MRRTLGGAAGGQIAATFVAGGTVPGLPALTGFTKTFAMAALVLICCAIAALPIPALTPIPPPSHPRPPELCRSADPLPLVTLLSATAALTPGRREPPVRRQR